MTVGSEANNKQNVTCLWFTNLQCLTEHEFHIDALNIIEPSAENRETSPIDATETPNNAVDRMW